MQYIIKYRLFKMILGTFCMRFHDLFEPLWPWSTRLLRLAKIDGNLGNRRKPHSTHKRVRTDFILLECDFYFITSFSHWVKSLGN